MRAVLVALALTGLADPSLAHHAFSADFDVNKPVKLAGPVTRVEWQNPHVWFYVDVKDEAGKVTNWAFETASTTGLARSGWTRGSLKVGDAVSVEGFAGRDGTPTAAARVVVLTATSQRLFSAAK